METLQKKLKFNLGQINERLLERTDTDILQRSASFIQNMVSTPFGSIRSRFGTLFVDEVGNTLSNVSVTTTTTSIGGTTSYLSDEDNQFISDGLGSATDLLKFDFATVGSRSFVEVSNISLDFGEASLTLGISGGVIDSVTVDDGGVGLVNPVITVDDSTGSGAILTPVVDSKGTITSVTITDGGSGYTDPVASVSSDPLALDIVCAISDDDISYTDVFTLSINNTNKSFQEEIPSDFRYFKMYVSSGVGSRLLIDTVLFYDVSSGTSDQRYKAKMIPFVFNRNQKYLMVLKDGVIDVYKDDSFLETIPASGLKGDYLFDVKYAQSEDTLILTHPEMPPKQIQRAGAGQFVNDIPIFDVGETSRSGYTISALGAGEYKAVDGGDFTYYTRGTWGLANAISANVTDVYTVSFDGLKDLTKIEIDMQYAKSVKVYGQKADDSYELILSKDFGGELSGGIYTFFRTNTQKRFFVITPSEQYKGLKIEMVGGLFLSKYTLQEIPFVVGAESSALYRAPRIFKIECYTTTSKLFRFSDFNFVGSPFYAFDGEVETQKNILLTPSTAEGSGSLTAFSPVFSEDSVGQYIDGNGGRFKITEYRTTKKVFGYTVIPFYTGNAFSNWKYVTGYERSWSESRGYPTTCAFYQQRLWFGGSKSRPTTLWGSRIGQYNVFTNTGNFKNDSIEATISSKTVEKILNIYPNRGIQIFTSGAEHVAAESTLTPDDITIIRNTSNGSLPEISPVDISGTTFFIEKNGRNLLSFVYSDQEASFTTANVSLLSDLIQDPTAMAFDYNSARADGNYLYIINALGDMVVSCIDLTQEVNSYVLFTTDGSYQDVVVLGTDVYLLIQRGVRLYLERVDDALTDATVIREPATTITDLSHLEGKDVKVYNELDGLIGTYTVDSGQITLPSLPSDSVNIGLEFPYALVSNKMYVGDNVENIEKRISKIVSITKDTEVLSINGDEQSGTVDRYTHYGISGYDRDVRFTISGSFYYCEIIAMNVYLNYGAK